MAPRRITDEDVLTSIVARAGDGYCLAAEVLPSLPKPPVARASGTRTAHAGRRRALNSAISRGLVLERRGPDGRSYVALASEGWRVLRAAA